MLFGKREGELFQTLEGHTRDALKCLKALVDRPGFKTFCRRWGINEQDALLSACLCVLLHDAGKGTRYFQEAIEEDKHRPDLPHPLFSLAVAHQIWSKGGYPSVWPIKGTPALELLAITAHHSLLWSDLYVHGIRREAHLDFELELAEVIKRSAAFASELFGIPELRNVPDPDFETLKRIKLVELVEGGLGFLKDITQGIEDKPRLKSIYTWLLSLVKGSDMLASRRFGEEASRMRKGVVGDLLDSVPVIWGIPEDLRERVLEDKTPYSYQSVLAEIDDPFVVLRAPCGRGKTEGALLWFARMMEVEGVDRLIFAMPTQVTSNAMRERLAKIFGEECVGLYHGRSFLEHREIARLIREERVEDEEIDPELEIQLAREENFLGEVMIKPVTVTTVDHILYSFVHGFRQADFALGCLQTAAIVFDEVHYYDRKMLSELRELFRILRRMHIPHLLMSGTLPDFLIAEAELEGYRLVEDEEGVEFRPFIIEKREEPLVVRGNWEVNDGVLKELLNGHERGHVQFVILNTVRKAQEVYKALKKAGIPREEMELLHSRFCYIHRREKENRVIELLKGGKKPFLLVSTQVIEVSLDISCDRMFTELAPMDALGQRAGRLNRGAEDPDEHKLIIFRPATVEGELDLLPYKSVAEVVERTWKTLAEVSVSYGDIKTWCDVVYDGYKLDPAQLPGLFEKCTLFGPNYDEIRFSEEEGKAFNPREIGMPTVDVIPYDLLVEEGGEGEVIEYIWRLAPVPVWWVSKSNREGLGLFREWEIGRRRFLICLIPYSSEVGFDEERIGEEPIGGVMI